MALELPDRCDGCGEPFEPGEAIEQVANLQPASGEASLIFVHHDRPEACLARFVGPGPAVEILTDDDVGGRLAGEVTDFLHARHRSA